MSRVTVVIPIYNAMPYLTECIDSILNQTIQEYDVIAVDDGSSDGSAEYLASIKDPRIRVLTQQRGGASAARKAAFLQSKTEYVAFMDADDISLPRRLQEQVEYLDKNPNVIMVGSQVRLIIGQVSQAGLKLPLDHETILHSFCSARGPMCNSSLMFRADKALPCFEYPEMQLGEEIDFCLKMSERGELANLPKVLVEYRLSEGQTSLSRTRDLVIGAHYAAYCYTCRIVGQIEPAMYDYKKNASTLDVMRWNQDAIVIAYYRKARILLASGNVIDKVRGYSNLVIASACNPRLFLQRVFAYRPFIALRKTI